MEKWSELRTALHVAELGTVSAAAAALGYHRATVNRHIDALEASIGARIFFRHAQGYTPTELGEEVLRVAKATRDLTDDLSGRIKGGAASASGVLKVSVLSPMAGLIMGPVDAFKTEHPNCLVEINTSEEMVRLEYGEAHIAIRSGDEPKHPDYIVHRLGRIRLNLYAHTDYIAKFGLPKGEHDLAGHRFVVPGRGDKRLPFSPWIAAHVRPEQIAVSSPNIWVNVDAIARGVGMGLMADHEAAIRPGMQQALPSDRRWFVRLWLTTHVDLHRTDKVQAMLKHIKSAFQKI